MKRTQFKFFALITSVLVLLSAYAGFYAKNAYAWFGELHINKTCDNASADLILHPDTQVVEAKINNQNVKHLDLNWGNEGSATFNAFIRWDTGETWSDIKVVSKPDNCGVPSPTPTATPTPKQSPQMGYPRTCPDFGKYTIASEPDWFNIIMEGIGPFYKTFTKPVNADFVIVNAGWQWFAGNPGPTQYNEIHKLTTNIGNVTVGDLGDEELINKTFWTNHMESNFGSDLNAKVEFAGDSSSKGSHIAHVKVEWCAASLATPTPQPTAAPTSTPQPTQTPQPTATPTSGPEPEQAKCTNLSASTTSGAAPLTVEFNGSGHDINGPILGYRFDFGDSSGGQSQTWEQTNQNAYHRYEKAGTYTATLSVKDQGGTWRGGGDECKKTITVSSVPQVLGGSTPGGILPETGSPLSAVATLLTVGSLGVYLYRRYKIL